MSETNAVSAHIGIGQQIEVREIEDGRVAWFCLCGNNNDFGDGFDCCDGFGRKVMWEEWDGAGWTPLSRHEQGSV